MNIFLRRVIWIVLIIPAVYLAIIWNQIPETVPLHFDLKGNANNYGSKTQLLWLVLWLTVANAVVYLIIANIYKIDPKKSAPQNKERMQRMAFYVAVYFSAICIMIIYAVAHSNSGIILRFVFVAMGLFFALLGSNMYNIKPNYFAGIRLPWTLESEDNWRKTHRLAGRLWFFGGLIFSLIALLVKSNEWLGYISFFFIGILVLIPVAYSYNLYKKSKK